MGAVWIHIPQTVGIELRPIEHRIDGISECPVVLDPPWGQHGEADQKHRGHPDDGLNPAPLPMPVKAAMRGFSKIMTTATYFV